MTTAAQDNATLSEIWTAYNNHLRDMMTAIDADPLTSGIPARVALVSFFDDGSVAHRREASVSGGEHFYRRWLKRTQS